MIERDDDELRTAFHQLRGNDVARAPEFRALFESAERVASRPARRFASRRKLRMIAAAAGLLLVLGVAHEISRRGHVARAALVPAITTWKSPTEGLLRTSDRELLAPSPLLTSVLGATAPHQRKGE
jgi:hypothetical protein